MCKFLNKYLIFTIKKEYWLYIFLKFFFLKLLMMSFLSFIIIIMFHKIIFKLHRIYIVKECASGNIERWNHLPDRDRIRPSIILIMYARTSRRLRTRVIANIARSLETGRALRACTRGAETEARTHLRSAHSHTGYARPLELHSFIKVASRAAPCLAPGRPFTSGAYAASHPTMHIRHIRTLRVSLHGRKKLCANSRDRYRRS